MSDNEKLIEAAMLLKKNCEKNHNRMGKCDCPLAIGERCPLHDSACPDSWVIPAPRRFTDADIALAKALKMFGVKYIAREVTGYSCDARSCTSSSGFVASLPETSFEGVRGCEIVSIDDIIKEGEQ